jgi:para-nitrobenzyl esterase
VNAYPPAIDVAGISAQTFYQPNVDGVLIPDKPSTLLRTGVYNHVPLIVGANADETSRSVPPNLSEAEYTAVVTGMFGLLAGRVLEMYPSGDFDTPSDAYIRLSTDAKFVCPSRSIAAWTASVQEPPVYRYFFTQDSGLAATSRFGAYHGLELLFVFGHLHIAGFDPTADQEELSAAMMTYWGALATDGALDAADAVPWVPYDASLDNTLVLEGGAVVMENEIRKTECDFWENLAGLLSI